MTERPPRSAATVVVIAEGKVLMVERALSQPFLGGFHGFPGGVVDRADRDLPGDGGAAGGETENPKASALRELFEETGLLLHSGDPGLVSLPEEWKRLNDGEVEFGALLAGRGDRLATSRLVDAGNWLTPPFSRRRFDTHFFLAEVPRAVPVEVASAELERCEWVGPEDALRRWREHGIMMVPPTLHMLRAVLAGSDMESRRAKAYSVPQASANPERRIESRLGIILFPMATRTLPPATHTNTILFGEGEMVIIDPASSEPREQDALIGLLDELRGEGREPREIVLSHHHPDHVGAVNRLKEERGLPVAAHPATAFLLRDTIRVEKLLHDGDRIVVEGPHRRTLEVLHTPGHAPGHLAFYEEATGTLLSGDNVLGHGSVLIDPPLGNMDEYLASLERMKRLRARVLAGGHGEMIGDPRAHIQGYIDHRLDRERAILGALTTGPLVPAAIVERVYTDVPVELHGLAERSVLAHLERLSAKGLVLSEGGVYRMEPDAGFS